MKTALICISCGYKNPPGTQHCGSCQALLKNTDTKLPEDMWPDVIYRKKMQQLLTPPTGTIALYIVGRDRPILIEVDGTVTLGRHVPEFPSPTVDLTQHHAGAMGVSRMHISIRLDKDGYLIEDLESTNGTWVNDEKIPPSEARRLQNGDQVRLGQFVFHISFATEPIP